MKIGDMLDQEIKRKLKKKYGEASHKEKKLTERDIEELMGARSYYRGKGGAIRQK